MALKLHFNAFWLIYGTLPLKCVFNTSRPTCHKPVYYMSQSYGCNWYLLLDVCNLKKTIFSLLIHIILKHLNVFFDWPKVQTPKYSVCEVSVEFKLSAWYNVFVFSPLLTRRTFLFYLVKCPTFVSTAFKWSHSEDIFLKNGFICK